MMDISRDMDSQQKSTMVVFLTDVLSVLQTLTNNTFHIQQKLCNYSEWPYSEYSPIAEFLEMNKQTSSQSKVHKQSSQVLI